ncbi:MAG TPA: choice-of-anchor D domain-containing protein [Terriglobia bacterium]|nr:choice-of-anchor D domain-containing protein [Terriglobia bacterium]
MKRLYYALVFVTSTALLLVGLETFGGPPALGRAPAERLWRPAGENGSQAAARRLSAPSAHLGRAGTSPSEFAQPASQAQNGHKSSLEDGSKSWREQYAKLPLSFEANLGQTDPQVKFLSRGSGYTLFLTKRDAVLTLHRSKVNGNPSRSATPSSKPTDAAHQATSALHMSLAGANAHLSPAGADELPGKVNYFIGNDPKKWQSNIPTYGKVQYPNVYPGIDLTYYGNQGQLEDDFVVSPGADPRSIRLRLRGADKVQVSPSGDLILSTRAGEVRLRKPEIYQALPVSMSAMRNRSSKLTLTRRPVSGHYVVRHHNEIGFEVGAYDRTQPLVIDPVLVYSSYLGGSNDEKLSGMDLASGDEMVVTGDTASDDFPTENPYQGTIGSGSTRNVFITEFSSDGTSLVFSTYLGGSAQDGGWGLVVDSSGNIYVDGFASSSNFPATANAYQGTFVGTPVTDYDVFLSKFDASGSRLLYSSYIGQMDFAAVQDGQIGLAANNTGKAYLAGTTNSSTFPVTSGALQIDFNGVDDGFVTVMDTTQSGPASLAYSTFIGGSGVDAILNDVIDSSGYIYITGHTTSNNFPTTAGAFQTACVQSSGTCSDDAFVAKINPAGQRSADLVYSTYLGGSGTDHGFSLAVDSSGNIYSTGFTNSSNFPTSPGAFQTMCGPDGTCESGANEKGYVTEINPGGHGSSDLIYSTYLSGEALDVPKFLVLDSQNDAYIVGRTTSQQFPVMNPLQAAKAGPANTSSCQTTSCAAYDGFITELNPTGTGLVFSTFNGGSNFDSWNAEVLDSSGNLYVGGRTSSTDYAATAGVFQPAHAAVVGGSAGLDAMVAKISPTSAAGVGLGPASLTFGNQAVGTTSSSQAIVLTAAGSASLTISDITVTGPFGQTNTCGTLPVTLTAGAQCTISVTFSPVTTGSQTGTLTIDDDATPSSQDVPLSGTGSMGTGAGVSFSPTSLTFASQTQGTTSAAQPITLTNNGSTALTITSISITGTNYLDFAQTNTCGTSVAAGANCTVNVTFTPTLVGYELAYVTVADNVTGSPQQQVALVGTGASSAAASGKVALSPANLTFGAQATGTTSSALTVTLSNVGNAALSITSIAPSTGFGETNTCGTSVAVGATCTINVTFSPTTTGAQTGTVTITDGAPNSPQTINISGTGGTPTVSFSPAIVTFASQNVGTTSASTPVTLTNTGGSPLSIVSIVASGDFSQTNNCASQVAASGTCTINVSFQPSTAGARVGFITVSDSDATSLQTLNLTGTGTVPTSTVVVSPPHAAVTPYETEQFVATISGTVSTNVTWSVDGTVGGTPTAGTISTSGVYIPPMTVGSHMVTATSIADSSQSASAPVVVTNFPGLYTRHNDNARDGQNLQENVLTTGNVNPAQFGLLFSYPVDAYTYAQPLYVANVNVPGQGNHNVVYVATENDSVFAYDADGLSPTPLWQVSFINPSAGLTTLGTSDVGNCPLIGPSLGITATPVIDPVTQTMYLIAATKQVSGGNTTYSQSLHALDITTGAERPGSPVVIQATAPGTGLASSGGQITLNPQYLTSRAGLLLANGVVYSAWASPCANGYSHGWLLGYDESSLAQVVVMNTTPNGEYGGIWPNVIPADSSGNIFVSTGDGTFDADSGGGLDYGDTYMKLVPSPSASPVGSFTVADYFTPSDQATLFSDDIDLSPGGPMLIPDQPTSPTHLMVGGGKEGSLYLIDRDNMGQYSDTGNNIVQTLTDVLGGRSTCVNTSSSPYTRCLFTQPAFWQNQVFYQAPYDNLKDFRLFNGQLSNPPILTSVATFGGSGAPLVVSANGATNGIVWSNVTAKSSPMVLTAYDAANITRVLYSSSMAGSRDTAGTSVIWTEPTVANGKVYIAGSTQLNVYGLLTPPAPSLTPVVSLAPTSLTFASQTEGTTSTAQVVTLTNTGVATLSVTNVSITGTDPGDFAQTNTCTSVPAGQNCTISVTFTPAATGTRTASVSITDNGPGSPQTVSLTGTGTSAAGPPAVSLSPTSLTFPLTVIGQAAPTQGVTLTNTGGSALSITSITITSPGTQYYKAYSQTNTCGTSVAAGASCTITVTYTAKQSSPPVTTATLSIYDNATGSPQTVALSGTGTFVKLVPTSLTFASQAVGATSAAQTVTLTNTLGQALALTVSITGTNPTDFAQTNTCGGSVAAGASCTFSVTFVPTAAGTRSATLSITDAGGGSPQTVALTGTATSTVTLAPTSLTFASQTVGTTSAAQAVTLSNTGTTALSITSITITPASPADFAQTNNCGTSVAAGANCTINVTFTPTATGTRTASVSVADSGPGSPQLVSLTGTGAAPAVTLSVPSLTFASQAVGTTSAAQAVTLTNTGTAALSITSISITGTNPGDFAQTNTCGTSVAAGANCSISVTFTPAASGTRSASISIADNATGSPQTVTLTGSGTGASTPAVTLAPASLTFTGLAVGTPTAAQTVTLTNSGGATLSITSVSITGTNSGDFGQSNSCGTSVAAGASCIINVTFTPLALGIRTASVSIADNATGSPQTVALTGTTGPVLSLSPSTGLTFPQTNVGSTSSAQTVTLTNTGNSTLTLTSIALTGANNADFSYTSTCGSGSLQPTGSCSLMVTFKPTTTGIRSASITITDNAPGSPQTVSLSGTGTTTPGARASLSPGSLTFTSQEVGSTSSSQIVTLTNNGSGTLSITSVTVTSSNFGQTTTCGTSLAVGASCTITVSFKPGVTGNLTGSVMVADNAPDSPQAIGLTGTAVAAGVGFSPSTGLVFKGQPLNTASAPQTLTLTNTGTAALSISSIAVIGSDASSFSQSNNCPMSSAGTLAAGGTCQITVTFTPTTGGNLSADLTVADSAPGSPHSVALTGAGSSFGLTAPSSSATVSAGQPASYTLSFAPTGGFNGSVSLSCTTTAPAASCSVKPTTLMLNAPNTATATATVTTTAGGAAPPNRHSPPGPSPWLWWVLAGVVALGYGLARRLRPPSTGWASAASPEPRTPNPGLLRWALAGALVLLLAWAGCGGSSSSTSTGPTSTPAGQYQVTVTAKSATASQNVSLTLTVQ